MLERQAAMCDTAPTVLVRNLIRIGLSSARSRAMSDALMELERAMSAVRTVVGVAHR